jgi:predicted RNA-binding Zn-ribbon protein involved in translation (DUF1610 family)
MDERRLFLLICPAGAAMINKITVRCTHCHQVSDLFLSVDARVVLFNCPTCWSTVLYYTGEIYILTKEQVKRIVSARDENDVLGLIEEVAHRPPPAPQAPLKGMVDYYSSPRQKIAIKAPSRSSTVISHDDVINLRIELENCCDVRDFLAHL